MRIEHIAVWTANLDAMRVFYERYFGARAGARYASENRRGFESYFLTFPSSGARLELMTIPNLAGGAVDPRVGYAHIAISLGTKDAVDELADRMREDGVTVRSWPRWTGDGYYEAVVQDPDGNAIEITG